MMACTRATAFRLLMALVNLRAVTISSSMLSPSSMMLFSTPTSFACWMMVLSTASSFPALIASSSAWVSSRTFLPAAETFRTAFSARASFCGSGFFFSNSARMVVSFAAMSAGKFVSEPARKARTSARPTWWKLIQSKIKVLFAAIHVGMWPMTTQSRLARVRATFKRRQSATNPTSPRWFARTRLKMMTSRSLPWKASTVDTWHAACTDCGKCRRISATWAP
mmetsp:Transcript_162967/g.522596  ORF Transcript_162967/g.522596 Transcript_162967/m.522596 type:complete len:223 (+) Transcript_162967:1596-2264(+)